MDGMAGGGEGGGDGGEDGQDAVETATDPIDLRYVDRQFQPLEAAKIRTALNPDNTVPEDAYLAVAKRYPTRIRLKMDMRRLPDLLTACGNAALTIEVRQVGINSQATKSMAGGSGGGGMEGMMGGGGMGGGGMGGGGMGGFGGGGEGDTEMSGMGGMGGMLGGSGGFGGLRNQVDEFPYQETVEIYAIVYLFNPVDEDKLGKPADAEDDEQPDMATGAALPAAADKHLAELTR
jgi:hypothetical protein